MMKAKEPGYLNELFLGLDVGVFAAKGVLVDHDRTSVVTFPIAGRPVEAAGKCIDHLLENYGNREIKIGVTGQNAALVAESVGIKPLLEIEALQAGLMHYRIKAKYVLSLGHENMHYLEMDGEGQIEYFSRNGQCAAGSGSFWYQQATRMGYNDRELAVVALEAESAVPISGRCAVFAKSDMTHAINEGATQSAVSAGMAKALVENVITGVARNRIKGDGLLAAVGGVANNGAVLKYLKEHCSQVGVDVMVPANHEYINAIGAAVKGITVRISVITEKKLRTPPYKPENPLPPLDPDTVNYILPEQKKTAYDLSKIYLGVDCGSVSTKCVLLDGNGIQIGGIYLPTTGRPALQVLELMKKVDEAYGELIGDVPIVACTTGSGRFLSQKILNAEYAVDEITCQAEGVKSLFPDDKTLSIIEIGGEDSKYIKLEKGMLFDYNMNPVCAAGTGTFLENLAELLEIDIKGEFSEKAFAAEYAVDLGDICTIISQSILASASARGLPLNEQLVSLAYSSAQNYLSRTVDKRPLDGRLIFAGATAKNHALAAALSAVTRQKIYVPPEPELTGALGSALMALKFHQMKIKGDYSFRSLKKIMHFEVSKRPCRAECKYDHNCMLNIISFTDGNKFIYGDRCGRYSGLEKADKGNELPDYAAERLALMEKVAPEPPEKGPRIGIARGGLYFDYYPYWAAFFKTLGARVIRSGETKAETLQKGKISLDSEMCYPMKVLIGHYRELSEKDLDYIFIPEIIDMEAMPWAPQWPRSFVCPLLQTVRGTVANSVAIDKEKILYAKLNYRSGIGRLRYQLKAIARKVMGKRFNENIFEQALENAENASENLRKEIVRVAEDSLKRLRENPDQPAVVFLSRGYTLYDEFVSKKAVRYARQTGMIALPHEYLVVYLQAWFNGEIKSVYLDPHREEFITYLDKEVKRMENIYPTQLQKILSAVIMVNFMNVKKSETGLPGLNLVLLDPFKCGPNAMLRHYLGEMTSYLRLTLDEHTAAAGLITRLEAFKNTVLTKKEFHKNTLLSSQTCSLIDRNWHKILIPEPTRHSGVFAAMFRQAGLKAEVLPRCAEGDLAMARQYINGEECLPFIQNLQDILQYLKNKGESNLNGEVFFQGWASGPCRYGLYAPTQSLVINKAGCREGRICAIKFADVNKRFGFGFVIGLYNALMVSDLLYKILHRVRPYEIQKGETDALFERFSDKLEKLLEGLDFKLSGILSSGYRKPLETFLKEAAGEFGKIEMKKEMRPRILLGGEFYVRLDDRCNQSVIAKIEKAGGEVCLAPATELFTYTLYIDALEALEDYKNFRRISSYFKYFLYMQILKIAQRDEMVLEKAAGPLIGGLEEPAPQQIMALASKYVSKHYGGEPPMTIGRAANFAERERVSGAIFVAPFTCMPGSVVEAQQRIMQEDLGIPIVTVYYDGKESANRDELVEGVIFQARQRFETRMPGAKHCQPCS